jgi:hypothetical protein
MEAPDAANTNALPQPVEAIPSTVKNPRGLTPGIRGGLMAPQWVKGQSGNPSGLTKEGLPSKPNRVRTTLQKKLSDPRTCRRFVDSWFEAACAGDSAAREQILKRLDPVVETDQGTQGKVILQGIRLELAPGSKAELTQLVQEGSSSSATVESLPAALPLVEQPPE